MTETKQIYDWRAARSGAAITINGSDLAGRAIRISQVAFIEPSPTAGSGAIAVTKGGERIWLRDRNALRTLQPKELMEAMGFDGKI